MAWIPTSSDILIALDTALSLLSLIGGLEQTIQTRHIQLQDSTDTALEAAAIACTLGRPDKALEWLEQGRCIVWNQIHNLRTPLDGLRIHNPALAKRILDVAKKLETAGSSREHSRIYLSLHQKTSLQEEASSHMSLAKQWDALLHQVRAIPGFELFLQPARYSILLQGLPQWGPIVVINVHEQRCDAIVLLAGLDEPLHIPLPKFSERKARGYQRDLGMQLHSRGLRARGEGLVPDGEHSTRGMGVYREERSVKDTPVRRILRGLWIDVVKPILCGWPSRCVRL